MPKSYERDYYEFLINNRAPSREAWNFQSFYLIIIHLDVRVYASENVHLVSEIENNSEKCGNVNNMPEAFGNSAFKFAVR